MLRPVESHSGARENIITGPYYPAPILYVFRSRRQRRREGGNVGREVSPHNPTRGSGKRRKLPQRVRSGAPAENGFMHIEAIWNTIFSIFERRRGPQTSRGPGKLPPFPPSRRACKCSTYNFVKNIGQFSKFFQRFNSHYVIGQYLTKLCVEHLGFTFLAYPVYACLIFAFLLFLVFLPDACAAHEQPTTCFLKLLLRYKINAYKNILNSNDVVKLQESTISE